MKFRLFRSTIALGLALSLSAMPILAQDNGSPVKPKSNLKALDNKNDPTLIGKRDINKGNLSFYSLDREVALGRQLAAEVDRNSRLVNDPLINEYVNRIAQNLVLHSDAKVPFTVKVLDADEVNAFALPGGFLYVNRGLLEAAENEAEVAGVMSHEIAHVTARHGVEQASKGELVQWGSLPLLFMGGLGGFIVQQVAGLAIPLTFLKFSRGAEKEADRLGAQYMWASGYDPNALVTFFEKLQAQEKRKPGTLEKAFSTHPMTGDRIKEARDLIVRFPDRGEYQISTSEFKEVKSRLVATKPSPSNNSRDNGRPTLKRRPRTDADDSVDSDNRPVLKRRDGSQATDPADTSKPETESTDDSTGRPVLKKRPDSTEPSTEKTTGEKPTGSSTKPSTSSSTSNE